MRVTLSSPELSTPQVRELPNVANITNAETTQEAKAPSFENVFLGAVEEAGQAQRDAAAKSQALAQGTLDDIHGTMISVKEAELSLKLVGTVRNRLLDAFHEIWRTNV